MKAYHVMMFLFIFNLFLIVIDSGLDIYDLGYSTNPLFNIFGNAGLSYLAVLLGAEAVSLASAAVIGGFFHVQNSAQGLAYVGFSTAFWVTYGYSLDVFVNILKDLEGAFVIYLIFTAIVGYIFLAGLYQMVTGGWKSYE